MANQIFSAGQCVLYSTLTWTNDGDPRILVGNYGMYYFATCTLKRKSVGEVGIEYRNIVRGNDFPDRFQPLVDDWNRMILSHENAHLSAITGLIRDHQETSLGIGWSDVSAAGVALTGATLKSLAFEQASVLAVSLAEKMIDLWGAIQQRSIIDRINQMAGIPPRNGP